MTVVIIVTVDTVLTVVTVVTVVTVEILAHKLDGVGPVDNRPSTN